jgi:hypothetical protein
MPQATNSPVYAGLSTVGPVTFTVACYTASSNLYTELRITNSVPLIDDGSRATANAAFTPSVSTEPLSIHQAPGTNQDLEHAYSKAGQSSTTSAAESLISTSNGSVFVSSTLVSTFDSKLCHISMTVIPAS